MKEYAIIYKKVWLNSNYIIFIPTFIVSGKENKEQHYFQNQNNIYLSLYNYERVEDEFYYDLISEKELLELYDTSDIKKASSNYFDDMVDNIIIGHIDSDKKTIELSNLPLYKLDGLTKNISYNINFEGMAEVRLTKRQLQSLSLESDVEALKRQISHYCNQSEKLESLYATKGITSVTFDALGNHLVNFSAVNQKNAESFTIKDSKESVNSTDISESSALTAYKYIVSRLIGQNDAVEDIVSTVVGNMKASNPHELIKPFVIGPTGSGKSLLFKLLGECLDIPVIIVDCNTIVQSGYEGKNIEDVLKDLYNLCEQDIFKTEHAIVFLDEIDKIASNGASVSDIGAQDALLKFIEGNKYVVELDRLGSETVAIDTSMMTIVAGGAFDNLTSRKDKSIGFNNNSHQTLNERIEVDDLKKYGMISELLARFNLFVQYNNVTEQMLYDSLVNSEISPLKIKQDYYLKAYNIKLTFNNDYIQRICEKAIESKSGFRGLTKAVNTSLKKLSFKLQCYPNQYHEAIVTADIIDNPKQYVLF